MLISFGKQYYNMAKFQIVINDFLGGFAPAWYKETYPSYGNKNQAGAMTNIDLTNPGYLCQGPGLDNLTNGTQAVAVTTLIKGATDYAVSTGIAFGVGGAKLYKFSNTEVTNDGTFPHTINKSSVTSEDGEDVCYYNSNLYYTYNHSGTKGDIGKYNMASTFDDDWGSTVPSGKSTLEGGVPHQMVVGGGVLFITNGRYVAAWDEASAKFRPHALDLQAGTVIQSIKWLNDRLYIAANYPNISGSNKNQSAVYIWDGADDVVESKIPLMGTVGGLYTKNGVMFVFYHDITSVGGYKFGAVSGNTIQDLANYTGSLPAFYQITDYKDFIMWNSNGIILAWGAGDKDLSVRLFQIADCGLSTIGCIVCPFGTPIIASTETTNYRLAKFSGYDTNSSYTTLIFDITGQDNKSLLEKINFTFEKLENNARVDLTIEDNGGRTIYTDTISYDKLGAVTFAGYPINKITENFRVVLNYANGDTTNTVKIKSIKIYGTVN